MTRIMAFAVAVLLSLPAAAQAEDPRATAARLQAEYEADKAAREEQAKRDAAAAIERQKQEAAAAAADIQRRNEEAKRKQARLNAPITLADYALIQTYMTYETVAEILGKPGKEVASSYVPGYATASYVWQNPDGSNMHATFQEGALLRDGKMRLIQKAQAGLR